MSSAVQKRMRLPTEYCPWCATERPEDFRFIAEAEARGAIIGTGQCPKHARRFFERLEYVDNMRVTEGRVAIDMNGKTFIGFKLLPESGMLFAEDKKIGM